MIDEKKAKLTEMVEDFCDEYLNEEYKQESLEIIEKMASGKSVYFKRGKLEVWSSAIIYAICQINSLFDESNENHITRKDILTYFNTKQNMVAKKARNLIDIYKLNETSLSIENHDPKFEDIDYEKMYENFMDQRFNGQKPTEKLNTIEDYQKAINKYRKELGEKFFEEHEGMFWLIPETRPYMQCLLEQADLFLTKGEKEKAINQYKYMLKLNPNDNQGVRDVLFPVLLQLNRIDEAEELYLEFEEEFSANWKFGKLLMDIKNNASFDEIEMQYNKCIENNPYVVDYLLGKKRLPIKIPYFYGMGDENEAIYYTLIAGNAWHDDKKAMNVLKKLSKK